ncbi:MAG: BrnA antitoxin family protein [Shinella sp.]|nr:BrnA antitoxin family protein [Shinella sp.]
MPNTKSKRVTIEPLSDEDEARIQAGIAQDPDNSEWTEEDLRNARPFAEVFPDLMESIRRARGRPAVEKPKQQVSLRLDPDVIAKFKATGKGWQARINEVLKQAKI